MKAPMQDIVAQLQNVPREKLVERLKAERRLKQLHRQEKARDNFLDFVRLVWPSFIAGRHHKIVAEHFEAIARGETRRLIINMPPRHTKSEFASYLFPAWMVGRNPI